MTNSQCAQMADGVLWRKTCNSTCTKEFIEVKPRKFSARNMLDQAKPRKFSAAKIFQVTVSWKLARVLTNDRQLCWDACKQKVSTQARSKPSADITMASLKYQANG